MTTWKYRLTGFPTPFVYTAAEAVTARVDMAGQESTNLTGNAAEIDALHKKVSELTSIVGRLVAAIESLDGPGAAGAIILASGGVRA